jgi:UDP-3-O-[3-hydroxymyristoyl] glucosamine N-acyltransferase
MLIHVHSYIGNSMLIHVHSYIGNSMLIHVHSYIGNSMLIHVHSYIGSYLMMSRNMFAAIAPTHTHSVWFFATFQIHVTQKDASNDCSHRKH